MKCRCGSELTSDSAYCFICGARRPYAWICEKCQHEVPWDHDVHLVCSTVCPQCGEAKPPTLGSSTINRPTAVLPNCSSFGQFVLLLGAIVSMIGCAYTVIVGVGSLFEKQWMVGLIVCPFCFLLQAAMSVVFLRVRSLGKEP
jgi:hypothetical protein